MNNGFPLQYLTIIATSKNASIEAADETQKKDQDDLDKRFKQLVKESPLPKVKLKY